MDAITSPATVTVGAKATAAQANSYKAGIDGAVKRIGGRATTNVAQAIAANTTTTLTNNGTAAWTATEDSGGFVSATGGTTTPIIIPAGEGGLYIIGWFVTLSAASAGLLWATPLINTVGNNHGQSLNYTGDRTGSSFTIPLNAADTLGLQVRTATAANASIGCELYCYRIGN